MRMRISLLVLVLCFGTMMLSACQDDVTQIVRINTRTDTVTKHDTTVKVDTVPVPVDTTHRPSGISVELYPAVLAFHLCNGCSPNQVYQLQWEVKHNGVRHSNQNVVFSSVQNGVVSLGSTGLLHPLKAGTALIIVTAVADTMAKDTTVVTVDGQAQQACTGTGCGTGAVVSIPTSPPGTVITTMRVGTSQQLTVYTSGISDPTGTWSTSRPQFLLVNTQTGIATAFSVGSSEVCFTLRTNPTNVPPACATFTVIP